MDWLGPGGGSRWALLEPIKSCAYGCNVGSIAGEVVDLLEVPTEETLMGRSGPLRCSGELAWTERCYLAVHVEPCAVGGRRSQPVVDEPVQRVGEPASLAHSCAEAQGTGKVAGTDLGGHAGHPQDREPAEEERRARPDRSGPALLDVWIGQVEPNALHARVGVIHRGEGQLPIRFHALVGP